MSDRELPDPLRFVDGGTVDAASWPRRRAELLGLFEREVYGRLPPTLPGFAASLAFEDRRALAGIATHLELDVRLAAPPAPVVRLSVWIPNAATRPVPAFLGLNFNGNHAVHPDPTIAITSAWVSTNAPIGVTDHAAVAASRGCNASRWPLETIVSRGYALATAYYGEIDPDFDDGFRNGIHAALPSARGDHDGGSVSAWAWGLSRLLDALETLPAIDRRRVAAIGQSRLGKTALWAGATDERFAMAWSNCSGCTGASVSRGKPANAESVAKINELFPHWFCRAYHRYGGRERELPVDQHELIALMAPRPVYVASAADDHWADQEGELLSCVAAGPVYRLLGQADLGTTVRPPLNQSIGGRIGYHIRPGPHDVTPLDWWHVLAFADRHLRATG